MTEGFEHFNDALKVIWSGRSKTIEFTYKAHKKDKLRRTVDLTKILRDENNEWGENSDRLYLSGFCHTRQEERLFNVWNIQSKIKMDHRYYDPYQFIEIVTGKPLISGQPDQQAYQVINIDVVKPISNAKSSNPIVLVNGKDFHFTNDGVYQSGEDKSAKVDYYDDKKKTSGGCLKWLVLIPAGLLIITVIIDLFT